MTSKSKASVGFEGLTVSQTTPNTPNCQFCTLTVFNVHPEAQHLRQPKSPPLKPLVSESDMARFAEQLEFFVMSQPEVPFDLAPSLFIQVVKVNMQGCKPLSLEAQGRLTDWIFSKKQSTPGFLGALAFLNPDLLRIWQVKDLFHCLPPSPGVSPSVPQTVVDDLVSHREGVDQMGRDVRRVIQTVTEASMNDAPTR
jgi:hypothetical protein